MFKITQLINLCSAGKAVKFDAVIDSKIFHVVFVPYRSAKYALLNIQSSNLDIIKEDVYLFENKMVWKDDRYITHPTEVLEDISNLMIKTRGKKWLQWNAKECGICYERKYIGHHLPCQHTICNNCYTKWSDINNTCPFCRETFFENI